MYRTILLTSLLGALMDFTMAIGTESAGAPELFVPAADLRREWNIRWENGDSSRACPDENGRFVMHALAPLGKNIERAELSCDFDAPRDGVMIMGIGADWWCEAVLNGKVVFSTMKSGNYFYPASARNYIVPVAVRAGKNRLVIHSRGGTVGWYQCIKFFAPDAEGMRMLSRRALNEFLMPGKAALDYTPFVSLHENRTVRVTFITRTACGGGVRYRTDREPWRKTYEMLGGRTRCNERVHHIELTGLEPGKTYEIQALAVAADDGGEMALGTVRQLNIPAVEQSDLSFFVFSDLHRTMEERIKLLQDYWSKCGMAGCDFLVSLGDFANKNDNFEYSTFSGGLEFLNSRDNRARPLIVLRGNHEFRGLEADEFFHCFAPRGEAWSAFRYGTAVLIVLDAGECDAWKPQPGSHTFLNLGEADYMRRQRAWLQKYVRSDEFKSARYRIVLAHGGPVSTGKNNYMADNLRRLIDGIFAGDKPEHKLDLWVAGHIHNYKYFAPGSVEKVPFPVIFCDGPDYGGREESALLVKIGKNGLRVFATDRNGICFEQHGFETPQQSTGK